MTQWASVCVVGSINSFAQFRFILRRDPAFCGTAFKHGDWLGSGYWKSRQCVAWTRGALCKKKLNLIDRHHIPSLHFIFLLSSQCLHRILEHTRSSTVIIHHDVLLGRAHFIRCITVSSLAKLLWLGRPQRKTTTYRGRRLT